MSTVDPDKECRPAAAFSAVAAILPASVLNADLPPSGRVLTVTHHKDNRPVHFHMPAGCAEAIHPMLVARGLSVSSKPYVDVEDESINDEYFALLDEMAA